MKKEQNMMNPEWAEAWAEALESGEYKQGQKYLTSIHYLNGPGQQSERDCCLGVLCKIVAKKCPGILIIEAKNESGGSHSRPDVVYYNGSKGVLPWTILDLLGLEPDCCDPFLKQPNGTWQKCSVLNDDKGSTFIEIAAMVRETYLKKEDQNANKD